MKNSGTLTSVLTAASLVLTLALVGGFSSRVAAQEKGASQLLRPAKPQPAPAAPAAQACPKCKDTEVTITEKPIKTGARANTYTVSRHECPDCTQKQTVTGHGKGKVTTVTHTCKASGSASATCCAMK